MRRRSGDFRYTVEYLDASGVQIDSCHDHVLSYWCEIWRFPVFIVQFLGLTLDVAIECGWLGHSELKISILQESGKVLGCECGRYSCTSSKLSV